jgi:zinc protease
MRRAGWAFTKTLIALLGFLGGCSGWGLRSAARADGQGSPTLEVLANGMHLIVQNDPAVDVVALYLFVAVGARDETPTQLGFSHFNEHMLFKGADSHGLGWVDRAVDGVGGRSGADTSLDYTYYDLVLPARNAGAGVRILAEMALRSKFDSVQLDHERHVILDEGRLAQDQPRTALIRGLYRLAFRDHPYGHPLLGTPQTLEAATRDAVFAYYKRHYVPQAMTLVVVGPISTAGVATVVHDTFGAVPATGDRRAPVPQPHPLTGGIRREVQRAEQQAYLAMGWLAPRADDPDGAALDLGTTILGGIESSRLTRTLRDRDHIVTGITMSYNALQGAGIVVLTAELEASALASAERRILDEIVRLQEDGVTEAERQLSVIQFEAQRAFDRERAERVAFALGIAETTWSLDAEEHYLDRLRRISREEIRDVARRYLSRTDYARLAFAPRAPAP